MKSTTGIPILCIQGDHTNIIAESELPDPIVAQIVVEVDRYLSDHPEMVNVFVLIEGWWEGFSILPVHDMSQDDLDYILLVATEAPKTQAAGVILRYIQLKRNVQNCN